MLLTRAPLGNQRIATPITPFDLHVLNTPPAFVLSQNQTLRKNSAGMTLFIAEQLFINQIDLVKLQSRIGSFLHRDRVLLKEHAAHNSIFLSLPNTQRFAPSNPNLLSGFPAVLGTSNARPHCQRSFARRQKRRSGLRFLKLCLDRLLVSRPPCFGRGRETTYTPTLRQPIS